MDLAKIKQLAGIDDQQLQDDLALLTEKVEIPAAASAEQVSRMMDAAKRAYKLASGLKDEAQRKKHFTQIRSGMSKISRHLKKMGATSGISTKKPRVRSKPAVAK